MLPALVTLSTAAAFGAMLFFPAVVAPSVFRVLDKDTAGTFLRKLFPAYYLYLIVAFALMTVGFWSRSWFGVGIAGALLLSTIWVRQALVPAINQARDRDMAGDAAGKQKFDQLHRLSVVINVIQMLALIVLMVW